MARRSTLSGSIETTADFDLPAPMLPGGFMPGAVAPFVMRYGTEFLVAMQRAAAVHDAQASPETSEPA